MSIQIAITERSKKYGYLFWKMDEDDKINSIFNKNNLKLEITDRSIANLKNKLSNNNLIKISDLLNKKLSINELIFKIKNLGLNEKEIQEVLKQTDTRVGIWFNNSYLGIKRIDWKFRRISLGWKFTRNIENNLTHYNLEKNAAGDIKIYCICIE